MSLKVRLAGALFLFMATFSIYAFSINMYGVTWDEPQYVRHSMRIEKWFSLLNTTDFTRAFDSDTIDDFWNYNRYHNSHPAFYKMSGIFFSKLSGWAWKHHPLWGYRLSTAFWAAVLILFICYYLMDVYKNLWIALLGGGLFFVTPRFFAHAHFFTTDMMVAALGFISLYMFHFWREKKYSLLFIPLSTGALLAVKFTGVLVFPMALMAIWNASDKQNFIKYYCRYFALAWVWFLLLNPHGWFDPLLELMFYFHSGLGREKAIQISTLYFGRYYDFRLPWHQPLVMIGITIPLLTTLFSMIGLASGIAWRKAQGYSFEAAATLFLLFVYILPTTPKHDGIRLFSLLWPFIIILSVRGVVWSTGILTLSSSKKRPFNRAPIQYAVLALMVGLSGYATCSMHPFQLSYYNALVGGPKGAHQKGFTITYWYEALDNRAVAKLNRIAENRTVKVYSYPNADMIEFNKSFGGLSQNVVRSDAISDADYVLLLNHMVPTSLRERLQNYPREVITRLNEGVVLLELIKLR